MADEKTETALPGVQADVPATGEKQLEDKDARRLKKALAALQKDKADLEKQLADFRKEIETSKLTEKEKVEKELAGLREQLTKHDGEKAAMEAEVAKERRVSILVAKHGLADPEFADVVLKKWDPAEDADFDAFVGKVKKDSRYSRLFSPPAAESKITNEDGTDIVPGAGTGVGNRRISMTSGVREVDEQIAVDLYPNSPTKQKAYIDTLQHMKRGK